MLAQITVGVLFTPAILGAIHALVSAVTYIAIGDTWNPLGLDRDRTAAWFCLGCFMSAVGLFLIAAMMKGENS